MPLPSSRNLSLKLGKSGKGTASIVENLKLQHAEELARANEEHVKEVEALENEVEQCRAEIDALKALSDEYTDKFCPLPSPSQSLKFVKNTPVRKARKGVSDKNVVSMLADLKAKHSKDLARAAEAYAKKLQELKSEIDKFKAETEALKASSVVKDGNQDCGSVGVNLLNTGVAAYDKENVAQMKSVNPNIPASALKTKPQQSGDLKTSGESENLDGLGNFRDQYERLFRDDYQFERDTVVEEALASRSDLEKDVNNVEIDEMCKDLASFMADIWPRDV